MNAQLAPASIEPGSAPTLAPIPAPAPAPAYAVREGDVARDRDAVLAIWRGNLGDDTRMPAKYAWFYEGADAGPPLLELLAADGREVGACSAGRRRMLLDGRPLHGGVLVDLAVLPEHRSLGPALMLQQGLAAAARRELDLLYGFPNPKAAPVFKRIGHRLLGELVRHVRVLRHADYLARRMPRPLARAAGPVLDQCTRLRDAMAHPDASRLRATWRDHVDARMQALWERSTKPDGVVAVRDLAQLEWRFDRSPHAGFRYLLLDDPHGGALSAWFATRPDGTTLHVHDYWSVHGPALGTRQLAALLRAAYAAGHAAVSVELCTAPALLEPWRALGFVERSRRPVFGCWSDPALASASTPLHLTAADEDE